MVSNDKIEHLAKTIALFHLALLDARKGGMSESDVKELTELVAQMFRDSLELDQLKQKPPRIKRLKEEYRPIVDCAFSLVWAGKNRRGMAGIIKRRLKLRRSEKQILRILDDQMPLLFETLETLSREK